MKVVREKYNKTKTKKPKKKNKKTKETETTTKKTYGYMRCGCHGINHIYLYEWGRAIIIINLFFLHALPFIGGCSYYQGEL